MACIERFLFFNEKYVKTMKEMLAQLETLAANTPLYLNNVFCVSLEMKQR